MKENQISDFAFARDLDSLKPTRVAPAFACGCKLLRRVLRVVDQHVGALRKLAQVVVELRHTGFVVRGIDDRADRRVQTVSQAALRMVQPSGGNMGAVHVPFLTALNLAKEA